MLKRKIIASLFAVITLCSCLVLPATANYEVLGKIAEVNKRCTEIHNLLKEDKSVDDQTLAYLKNTILTELKNIQNSSGGSGASSQQIADLTTKVNTLSSQITTLQNSLNTLQTEVNNIDVAGDIESFYESKTNVAIKVDSDPLKLIEDSNNVIQSSVMNIWDIIYQSFFDRSSGLATSLGITLDPADYAAGSAVFNALKIFAYSLVILFFAVNLTETTLKYEIMTFRGAASILGRLLISKTLIDISSKICLLIIDTMTWLTGEVLGSSLISLDFSFFSVNPEKSDLWVIGAIIDFFNGIIAFIQMLPVGIVFIVCGAIICIKLLLRSIELSLLTAVSPVMFACASSEVTKPYFKNFIVTFIQVAAQIVFMALVYVICMQNVCNGVAAMKTASGFLAWNLKLLPTSLLLIAMCIMMCKPPKVLTTLIH